MVLQMLQCCSCMEGPAISPQGKEEADRLEKAQRQTNESVHYVSRVGFAEATWGWRAPYGYILFAQMG